MRKLALLALPAAALVGLLTLVAIAAAAQPSLAGIPTAAARTEIPDRLLAVYQQAAADRCPGLGWQTLAAIGGIESRHGSTGGARLDDTLTAVPPIIGPTLDGTHGTARVADTDGGRYDHDPTYDRAVGPDAAAPGHLDRATGWTRPGTGPPTRRTPSTPPTPPPPTSATTAPTTPTGSARRSSPTTTPGPTSTSVLALADRYATLGDGPADPALAQAVLDNPRITIYAAGRADIAAGRIDPRVLDTLQALSRRWTIAVSSLQSGHSKCVGGGAYAGCSVSNHWYGRAVDIYRVNGRPVTAGNPDARDIVDTLYTHDRPRPSRRDRLTLARPRPPPRPVLRRRPRRPPAPRLGHEPSLISSDEGARAVRQGCGSSQLVSP